jgi:hypothetical protein
MSGQMYRDYICEDCMNKYSPGMFTTSQCQNLIGPTNKTKQRIIFFVYKNTMSLDKLFLMPKNYFCLFVVFLTLGRLTILIQVLKRILKRRPCVLIVERLD